jgi:hypothetical protein
LLNPAAPQLVNRDRDTQGVYPARGDLPVVVDDSDVAGGSGDERTPRLGYRVAPPTRLVERRFDPAGAFAMTDVDVARVACSLR